MTASQPCLHHCHCKAFKKKQQPLESWWHRVCREGLGLSAHLLHGIGAWLLPYTKTPYWSPGLHPKRYTPRLLTVQTRESSPPREPFPPGVMQAATWQPMPNTNHLQSRCSNHILPSPLQHQIHKEFNTVLTKWCSQNLLSYFRAKLRAGDIHGNMFSKGLRCIRSLSVTHATISRLCAQESLTLSLAMGRVWVFSLLLVVGAGKCVCHRAW